MADAAQSALSSSHKRPRSSTAAASGMYEHGNDDHKMHDNDDRPAAPPATAAASSVLHLPIAPMLHSPAAARSNVITPPSETASWLASEPVQRLLHQADMKLKSLLVNEDNATRTVATLKEHVAAGTVPPSLRTKIVASLPDSVASKHTDSLNALRKSYEENVLKVVLEARSEHLDDITADLRAFVPDQRVKILSFIASEFSESRLKILPDERPSASPDQLSDFFITALKAKIRKTAAEHDAKQKAQHEKKKQDQAKKMEITEAVQNAPEKSLAELVKMTLNQELAKRNLQPKVAAHPPKMKPQSQKKDGSQSKGHSHKSDKVSGKFQQGISAQQKNAQHPPKEVIAHSSSSKKHQGKGNDSGQKKPGQKPKPQSGNGGNKQSHKSKAL
jgi:hypothetical protein